MNVLDWLLSILTLFAAVPIGFLLIVTLASLLPIPSQSVSTPIRPVCTILIPAHNEELGIADTLRNLLPHLREGDRVLVVADNCSDRTAEIARTFARVEVLERHHASERGKGYALEAGLLHLATQPPEYVVIFDADCRFGTGSLDALLSDCEKVQLPTQAVYLPGIRQDGSVRSQWATFALRFKNEARPSGLYQLGMSCLLLGSGMAFSWKVVRAVSWGTGNIVEDMRLGIDLAIAGYSPRFCPHARVTSDAPPSDQAAQKQRTRWEHGHVSTLLTQTPRLLLQALRQLRPRLLGLALELSVPPLSLLVLGLIGLIGLSGLSWWLLEGSAIPLFAGVIALTSLILTIFLAWCKYGRGIVPIGSLLLIPVYLLWKVPIYLRLVGRRERNWVRTDRA